MSTRCTVQSRDRANLSKVNRRDLPFNQQLRAVQQENAAQSPEFPILAGLSLRLYETNKYLNEESTWVALFAVGAFTPEDDARWCIGLKA